MLLLPKKSKYRRTFKGRNPGLATRGSKVNFGEYALKAMDRCFISSRQLESARKVIMHQLKRNGKLWIRIFPDKPITKKPNEIRMGSGKGAADHYVAVIKPGRILFELGGVTQEEAKKAFQLAAYKLPLPTQFITAEGLRDGK